MRELVAEKKVIRTQRQYLEAKNQPTRMQKILNAKPQFSPRLMNAPITVRRGKYNLW